MIKGKNMIKAKFGTIFVALALGIALPSIVAPSIGYAQSGKTNAQLLAEVNKHMQVVRTMKSDFVQTNRNGQQVKGKMILQRPGKVRFQYVNDASLLIVADGNALTMVDYEVNQVQRWPIKNSPLSALLDSNKDLTRYGKIKPTNNPNVISVEVRDPKRPEYGVITMFFVRESDAPAGLNLRGWVALDSKNNRTTVELSKINFNTPVSKASFRWRDPRRNRGPRR